MSELEAPESIRDIITIPYDAVSAEYKKRLEALKQREVDFREHKAEVAQTLNDLLKLYTNDSINDSAAVAEPRIRARMRGLIIEAIGHGSPQARYANALKGELEDILNQRIGPKGDTPETRKDIARKVSNFFHSIEPRYQLSTDTFVGDIGLTQTAAVVSIDSLARGKDKEGNPIPGEFYMAGGYSALDLVEHTDFIGTLGLMLKRKPLTEEEHARFLQYMSSKIDLTDKERSIIDINMENISGIPIKDAQITMDSTNMVMKYLFGKLDYVDIPLLNQKANSKTEEDIKAQRDNIFYGVLDNGLTISAHVLASTAYAVRKLIARDGNDHESMPMDLDPKLNWGGKFLTMAYGKRIMDDPLFEQKADTLETYFQLLVSHGAGNASTFATRTAGGVQTDINSALSAGNNVLSGGMHGFANFLVPNQVNPIYEKLKKEGNGKITDDMIRREIDLIWEEVGKYFGIGHNVYNADPERMLPGDPRTGVLIKIIRDSGNEQANEHLDHYLRWRYHAVAKLEEEKKKYNIFPANVDFLSPIVLQDLTNLPVEANPSIFGATRVNGHLVHFIEALQFDIIRSKTVYLGGKGKDYATDFALQNNEKQVTK